MRCVPVEYYFGSNAYMAVAQTKNNRGLYKDCLHVMYMPYCSIFFTNDKHFIETKSEEPVAFWDRIWNVEDFIAKIKTLTEDDEVPVG